MGRIYVKTLPRRESCTCDIIRQLFASPDEIVNFGHVQRAFDLNAECGQYLFKYCIEKRIGDFFPECFKPPEKTIKITSFKVEPTEIYVGENVSVTAMLQGTPNSTWTAELYVNDNKVDEKSITLSYDG